MSIKWIKTAHRGLRYYEHDSRQQGKKKDRYYSIRIKVGGKDYTYGVGWWSDGIPEEVKQNNPGIGFEEYALSQMRLYKANIKAGSGPRSPRERRRILEEKEAEERAAKELAERENITFGYYFKNVYFPTSKTGRKEDSIRKDNEHFKKWIEPVIGNMPLKDVRPFTIEKIKKNVLDAGKKPRTLQYVFATIRQIWNMARRDGLVAGDSPTKKVKVPKVDNKRVRFLSHGEAEALLNALQAKDSVAHNLALLSLHTGLRIGEMANLKWSHIDLNRGIITVMDPKGGEGRVAFMTKKIKDIFEDMKRRRPDDYVFVKKDGKRLREMPKVFFEVVKNLGLNEDIADPRQKVVAHTLRHTFASWHVEAGTDLYTVKSLMGHSVISMTERYSHLSPGTLQNATRTLERAIGNTKQKKNKDQSGQVVNFKK